MEKQSVEEPPILPKKIFKKKKNFKTTLENSIFLSSKPLPYFPNTQKDCSNTTRRLHALTLSSQPLPIQKLQNYRHHQNNSRSAKQTSGFSNLKLRNRSLLAHYLSIIYHLHSSYACLFDSLFYLVREGRKRCIIHQ